MRRLAQLGRGGRGGNFVFGGMAPGASTAPIPEGDDLATIITNEVPAGTIDGTNAVFTLASPPAGGSLMLFLNGVLQNPGASNDYTISGATITFTNSPPLASTLLASYRY